MSGLKEEIKGKILGKPELVKHGRDRRMGNLAKRASEEVSDGLLARYRYILIFAM